MKRHAKPEGRRNLPAHLAAYVRDCGRFVSRPARTELAAPRNLNPADDSFGVIYAPGSSGHTTVHVRFTPKATIENQNLIRRFVPIAT